MTLDVLGDVGQCDGRVGDVFLGGVGEIVVEQRQRPELRQGALHLDVGAADGQHLQHNAPGLHVGHKLALQRRAGSAVSAAGIAGGAEKTERPVLDQAGGHEELTVCRSFVGAGLAARGGRVVSMSAVHPAVDV